ncbi:Rossmann-like domain-containing protein [Dongshaea marina]|uniref:Rossmann-like domain-containing protein n=1 Tax=Dongshaea marina TaxID=2047966 RepID=UPI000D3EA259|nr:DUF364 domain-containing protein [Dongshaea marina]
MQGKVAALRKLGLRDRSIWKLMVTCGATQLSYVQFSKQLHQAELSHMRQPINVVQDINHLYALLKEELIQQVNKFNLHREKLTINCQALSSVDAIGFPAHQDYPIVRGHEKMIEADFLGSRGQAFTDHYQNSEYSLQQLLELPLETNRQRADFIAALNAVYRHLKQCDRTVHCKNDELALCGQQVVNAVEADQNILLIGLQPRLLENLSRRQLVRVIDLDPANIGQRKYGITIEGESQTDAAIEWCDQIMATGSTLVNGTICHFLQSNKPVTFFGVTISAAARILKLNHYCVCGH